MRRPLIAASLLISLTIAGAAVADEFETVPATIPDFASFIMMRVGEGPPTAVSLDSAADALKDYDVVFIGEWHDHIGNHIAELDLLRALQTRAPKIALSMEMFERDVQPVLDDYLAGKIGEETLKTKGRAWSNYAESYRPLVEFAKDHGLPVIAANAPEAVVRCVGQEGPDYLAKLPTDHRLWAAAELHTEDGPYKEKFLGFLSGDAAHGGPPSANEAAAKARAERSFAAQVTRDDTMAESIALYLEKNPGAKVVHVTGAFHVEGRLGTLERLKMRAPNLKLALIVPVEAAHPDAPAMAASDGKGADYALLLRPEPKSYVTDDERKAAEAHEMASFRNANPARCGQ